MSDPSSDLTPPAFLELLDQLAAEPIEEEGDALAALLFHGARTRELLESHGYGDLDLERTERLERELAITHAWIELRVVDDCGIPRLHLAPHRVPLDVKQHLHVDDVIGLEPAEVSGTVRRVGVDHLWVRL